MGHSLAVQEGPELSVQRTGANAEAPTPHWLFLFFIFFGVSDPSTWIINRV
jgi:hypothetical protein